MNPGDNRELTDRESRLMESLLERAVKSSTQEDTARVENLMSVIHAESDGQTVVPRTSHSRPDRMIRWLPIPVAAGILIAIVVLTLPNGSGNAALAALDRTIAAEEKPNAREYTVSITRRALGSMRTLEHRLFVRRREFAITRKLLIGTGELWMGGRDDERWIVPGPRPVLVGGEDLFNHAALSPQIVETPFLSVARILERTKRFYELTLTSEVSLQQGERTIRCQHIVGKRIRSPRIVIPKQVEVWADPQTGFAQRVRLVWDEEEESRWREATADLVGTPTLSDDFFDHTAHHEPGRRVIIRN